jgi:hypothetical protein
MKYHKPENFNPGYHAVASAPRKSLADGEGIPLLEFQKQPVGNALPMSEQPPTTHRTTGQNIEFILAGSIHITLCTIFELAITAIIIGLMSTFLLPMAVMMGWIFLLGFAIGCKPNNISYFFNIPKEDEHTIKQAQGLYLGLFALVFVSFLAASLSLDWIKEWTGISGAFETYFAINVASSLSFSVAMLFTKIAVNTPMTSGIAHWMSFPMTRHTMVNLYNNFKDPTSEFIPALDRKIRP